MHFEVVHSHSAFVEKAGKRTPVTRLYLAEIKELAELPILKTMLANGASSDYSVLKWTNWKDSLSSYPYNQKCGIHLHDIREKILCGSYRALT